MPFDDVLVIIPVRKGSKRLPGKNKVIFAGKPLWLNSVHIAKEAGIKKIVVSTDDNEIIDHFVEGVNFLKRSEKAASDEATQDDVIIEVVHQLTQQGIKYKEYKTICVLHATSPLLKPTTLTHALHRFQDESMRCLIAYNQDYKPCGAFYIFRQAEFAFYGNSVYGIDDLHIYILPPEQAIDIDNIWDWRAAQAVKSGRVVEH